MEVSELFEGAIQLLQKMISTPSFSREEDKTADILQDYLRGHGISTERSKNNVWASSQNHRSDVPVILLNSHHDTVKPSGDWEQDPFTPFLQDDKLIGLGSNDAGGSVVALVATFLYLNSLPKLPYKLILAISAEEEVSGKNGVKSILSQLGPIDLGVVGEPTTMQMAIAEKGLIVLDCIARGKAGHAARDEGINALYLAIKDIDWFRSHKFDRSSELLGYSKMSVTQISGGQQHNMVPDECRFVVDIRTNERYSNDEVLQIVQSNIDSEISPRSYHLNSSAIPIDHPVVVKGNDLGLQSYGSPTLSDQAMMDFWTLKIGPGHSSRSHTAGEFIYVSEIEHGIQTYIELLQDLQLD